MEYRIISRCNKGPVVVYITGPFMNYTSEEIYDRVINNTKIDDFILCEVMVDNWDAMLTPWKADDCIKNRIFYGFGADTISYIRKNVLPAISEINNEATIYICGYSLAGLFSLWTLYECEEFAGAACCSGSLWYPEFDKYYESHSFNREVLVYLSLGKKEEKTKHPVMSKIGDATRNYYDKIINMENVKKTTLEWNEGGHFADGVLRVSAGISWMILQNI